MMFVNSVFFFKQKTAYEMRISDWSSDVCSSDLGAVTALAFKTAVDDPHRFVHSADVGPHFGLTPRRYQSGEVDRSGRISKCGDALVRSLQIGRASCRERVCQFG